MAGSKYVVRATEKHIRPVAKNLRQSDADEVWASHGLLPKEAVSMSFAGSDRAWTALSPSTGEPFAMFGAKRGSILSGESRVWLLSTDEIDRWRIAFARSSRAYIRSMAEMYGVLTNYVDVRNSVSIAWLKWLGAEFEAPAPWGEMGFEFQRFVIRRETICAS